MSEQTPPTDSPEVLECPCRLSLGPLIERALAEARREGADLTQAFDCDSSAFNGITCNLPHEPIPNGRSTRTGIAGNGQAWREQANLDLNTDLSSPDQSDMDVIIKPKQNHSRKRRRGKESSKRRQIKRSKGTEESIGQLPDQDSRLARLEIGWKSRAKYELNGQYSILRDGSRTSTGWNGLPPVKQRRDQLTRDLLSGKLNETLRTFHRVHYDGKRPAALMDCERRVFFYRSTPPWWFDGDEFCKAIFNLTSASLNDEKLRVQSLGSERGPHFACIIGHHRQSLVAPQLTKWHRDNEPGVKEFLSNSMFKRLVGWIKSIVTMIYPGVAKRFMQSAEWHWNEHKIEPLFGLFWNFCINMPFPGQNRIQCLPHADSKNVIGVCVVFVYLKPGGHFDHRSKSWLVIWEAGVIIELPPWVAAIYPSSLLFHFNIDVSDLQVVVTSDGEQPTPTNSQLASIEENGRGSVVFFNQATMYQSSETGFNTLQDAKKAGHSGTTNFGLDAQTAFQIYGTISSNV